MKHIVTVRSRTLVACVVLHVRQLAVALAAVLDLFIAIAVVGSTASALSSHDSVSLLSLFDSNISYSCAYPTVEMLTSSVPTAA